MLLYGLWEQRFGGVRNMATNGTGLGERVKNLRVERKWTQSELARRANTSQSNINLIESGERSDIKFDTIIGIARAFRVSTDEIMGYDKDALTEPALEPADHVRLNAVEVGLAAVRKDLADLAQMTQKGFEHIAAHFPASGAGKKPTRRKRS